MPLVFDQAASLTLPFNFLLSSELNPIYIVRYEDLVNQPKETYEGIFKYLLEIDDIEGTNAQRRIEQVVAQGRSATQTYKFKATTGQLNTNAKRYTKEQVDYIKQELGDLLYFFGYSNIDEESYSNFYQFDEHTEERKALHNGYKKVNEDSMKYVVNPEKEVKLYAHNYQKDMIPLLPPHLLARAQEPGMEWAKKCLEHKEGE